MPQKLANSPQIWTLAKDLGLKRSADPVKEIVGFARRKVESLLDGISCETLSDLLKFAAAKVDTLFVEIHSDEELIDVKHRYTLEGELAFADLESQLGPHVYAITFRRKVRQSYDRRFVSVIDSRGEKAARSYFSKWHEIAHLLTLTSQQRLKFYRTHLPMEVKDPEEILMDVIAGELGFFDGIVQPYVKSSLSFSTISDLREQLCPEASAQASLIGFVHAWPRPCLLVEAELAWKKRDAEQLHQGVLEFHKRPAAALRAVRITPNLAARESNLFIPTNMRVPKESVIARIFSEDIPALEATEDLSWWNASNGSSLSKQTVQVVARRVGRRVQALISLAQ